MKMGIFERDCLLHVVHNCMHDGCDVLPIDIDTLLLENKVPNRI